MGEATPLSLRARGQESQALRTCGFKVRKLGLDRKGPRFDDLQELGDSMSQPQSNAPTPRRTMLLTGASRGIGHATVKRFSSAGWRVRTCSRHPFPEECPWMMGPEDHLQID